MIWGKANTCSSLEERTRSFVPLSRNRRFDEAAARRTHTCRYCRDAQGVGAVDTGMQGVEEKTAEWVYEPYGQRVGDQVEKNGRRYVGGESSSMHSGL